MKKITKISTQKKPGRYNIFLDDAYAFSVSSKVIADFVLTKDKELTTEQIDQIKQADLNAKAENKALHYLSYQPRTIKELKDYLRDEEVDSKIIDEIIVNLSNLGYLNDQEYSKLFIQNNLKVGTDGPKGVLNKLIKKGVDKELASLELENVESEDWQNLALKLSVPMLKKASRLSKRDIQMKIKQKLYQHGFSNNMIDTTINNLDFNDLEGQQLEALKIQGIKAFKKARKLDGYEKNQKIKQILFQKGFNSEEINQFIAGEIIPLEELAEY